MVLPEQGPPIHPSDQEAGRVRARESNPANTQELAFQYDMFVIDDVCSRNPGYAGWLRQQLEHGTMYLDWHRHHRHLWGRMQYPRIHKRTEDARKEDMQYVLSAVFPELYPYHIWSAPCLITLEDKDAQPLFCFELGINLGTTLPSPFKERSREAWLRRAYIMQDRRRMVCRYPWRVPGPPPTPEELLYFMTFEKWGHYMCGPVDGIEETAGHPEHYITMVASLTGTAGRAREVKWIEVPRRRSAPAKWELMCLYTAEAYLKTDYGNIVFMPFFVAKYGLEAITPLLCSSPLNPNVDQDRDTIPGDLAIRFEGRSSSGSVGGATHRRRRSFGQQVSPGGGPVPAVQISFGASASSSPGIRDEQNAAAVDEGAESQSGAQDGMDMGMDE